jgi:hypothetical protein
VAEFDGSDGRDGEQSNCEDPLELHGGGDGDEDEEGWRSCREPANFAVSERK